MALNISRARVASIARIPVAQARLLWELVMSGGRVCRMRS